MDNSLLGIFIKHTRILSFSFYLILLTAFSNLNHCIINFKKAQLTVHAPGNYTINLLLKLVTEASIRQTAPQLLSPPESTNGPVLEQQSPGIPLAAGSQ